MALVGGDRRAGEAAVASGGGWLRLRNRA